MKEETVAVLCESSEIQTATHKHRDNSSQIRSEFCQSCIANDHWLVDKSSTGGRGKGGSAASAVWQITLCDPDRLNKAYLLTIPYGTQAAVAVRSF